MAPDRKNIADYLTITGGVLGRLAISLVYFLIVANALPVGDFGIFAAASAVGLILSRLLAFGFISPVYRAATVKPRILGAYVGGLGVLSLLSLPPIAAIASAIHAVFFQGQVGLATFLLIVTAEVIGTRIMEFGVITLNGLSRFAAGARLVIVASAIRTGAAVLFYLAAARTLDAWAWYNLGSALLGAAIALGVILATVRPRIVWRLYGRRMRDAATTAASELAFYAQSELDKVLVLALAGAQAAGIYAIAMRLIDLTAIPVRSFNQMLVQQRMRDRDHAIRLGRSLVLEGGIALVSTLGMLGFVILLWPEPALLGSNIARAVPVLLPMLLIPAFRNLVEFHGELLYAREYVATRLALLCGLLALKLGLMAALVRGQPDVMTWALPLTGVFAVLYLVSAAVTYGRLGGSRR